MSPARRFKRVEDLDGAQRAAASARGNAVVAAGAGSGKTTVLAARYVHLLETDFMPSGERVHSRNVLVLTFTRKAAAEMYSRIHGALAEAAALARAGAIPGSAPDGDAGLAGHLSACLADFSQAQISTFDSFAARIARSGSSRFGLSPDFAVDEDRARRMARDLALSFILEHRETRAIRDLVSSAGLEGARDEVLAELAVRRMGLSSPPDFRAFHGLQTAALEAMEAKARAAVIGLRAAALALPAEGATPTSKAWLEALARDAPEEEEGFLAFLSGLEGLRKPGANARDEASRYLSLKVDAIREAVAAYRGIAATKAAQPERLELYRLLDEFRSSWDAARRSEKILTFRDVAELALDALKADPAIRRHYQGLYRYVMIDEFQDDDELQKRVLFLLAARAPEAHGSSSSEPTARDLTEDKLFFVGDEKQSIYLFRGADVSVFRRLAGELEAAAREVSSPPRPSQRPPVPDPAALGLSRNYRSEPGLIDMINRIFSAVMAPRDPEASGRDAALADFEARFEPLESRGPTPGIEPRFVYLELLRGEGRAGEARAPRDPAECEAWEVARLVRDAVEGGGLLVADRKAGRARAARYEDFAVLLRSTGNQLHFEKYFRLFDVPYGAENACGLFSEAVACDLYYALRLALYPRDRNAVAAYLRSPLAGLSDEAVVRLLLDEAADPLSPEAESLLPERDRGGWARGAASLRTIMAMADRAPIARCLSFLWFEAGYRAALLRDPVASAFEEHFELVHSLAVDADARGSSLAAFVAELEPLVGKPDKLEVEIPRESSRGVRIMTVHKSKGLEFPVVIVPQANNVGRDGGARDAWYWAEGLGPTFKPADEIGSRPRNAFFESARASRAAMEGAELKRLLYVALTRAESHIVVTATEPYREDARERSFRSLLAGPLGLLAPPSPLGGGDSSAAGVEARPIAGRLGLPPFGELAALPSGALVGLIPERSDSEYFALVAGAKRRAAPVAAPAEIPLVERRAWPLASSVTAIAERYAAEAEALSSGAGLARGPARALEIRPDLASPPRLSPETWGSLVHALLQSRLSQRPTELRLSRSLQRALDESLEGEAAIREAIERGSKLADAFTESELGRRALASSERHVELRVAIGLSADGREVPRGAPRSARGSIDLAFMEDGRVIVVDYKTDAVVAVGAHDMQLAAYKRAASELFARPCEAWVFYLYGGGIAFRIDENGQAPRLEDAPPARPSQALIFG